MTRSTYSSATPLGWLAAAWGTAGVIAMLLWAIWRLGHRAVDAVQQGLSGGQWTLLVAICVFMAWSEGYRGFQQRFSPRTAARVRYLRDHPRPLHVLVAPLFAMGFVYATRRTRLTAIAVFVGVIGLVLLVHRLDQPWRGIIDAGVVVGLGWGVVSLLLALGAALARPDFPASPEVPAGAAGQRSGSTSTTPVSRS